MSRVVVFDSGQGSKKVTTMLRKRFPKHEFIRYVDSHHYPYGNKSQGELILAIGETIHHIIDHYYPKLIICASITPSILVLPYLKQNKDLKFIETIGTRLLFDHGHMKESLYLITNGLKELAIDNKFNYHLSSRLVDLVESGKYREFPKNTIRIIKAELNPVITKDITTLVLGSTHLGYLTPFFKKLYPKLAIIEPYEQLMKDVEPILK